MNVTLSGDAWEQSTLPVANGGIGVRRATGVALLAYLSSVAGSHAFVIQLFSQALHKVAGRGDRGRLNQFLLFCLHGLCA